MTVFKISFATGPHALGKHTGPDIFHFVVFLIMYCPSTAKEVQLLSDHDKKTDYNEIAGRQ